MDKDECVNALKHMAAYKFLSLLNVEKHGLKDSSPLQKEQFVTVETHQLNVLNSAIFHLSGEHFDTDELRRASAAQGETS